MVKTKYTNDQIQELLNNKYVKSCTSKNINFTLECKRKSVKLWNKGFTTKEIFKKLGFPEYINNSNIPSSSINRWKKNINKGSLELKKGRPKKEKIDFNNMTLEQENEYLRAENAYLKELKKLVEGNYP